MFEAWAQSVDSPLTVTALAALFVGLALGWWLRSKSARIETNAVRAISNHELELVHQRVRELASESEKLEARTEFLTDDRDDLRLDVARKSAMLDQIPELRSQLDELRSRLAELDHAHQELLARNASMESSAQARLGRISEIAAERDRARNELETLRETNTALRSDLDKQTIEFHERRKALDGQLELVKDAERQLTQQFENMANRIFNTKSDSFRRSSAEQITSLLKPFREQIDGLHRDVREASKERHTLGKEIERIVTETNALTQALRGDSKTQGDWGELVLERLLEQSGLRRGVEYEIQSTVTDEQGRRMRPDVILHLPDKRDVVLDSKVSLTAYERYANSENPEQRAAHLKAHVQSVRRHMDALAEKRYDHARQIRSLDYTLMWVPIEPAYFAVMQAEPGLVSQAMEKRVIPVCATTLLAVLKTIERVWQYEHQSQNVERVVDRAGLLYDKFVGFVEALDGVGEGLKKAEENYEIARNRLVSGPGNLIRQTEKLREMGVSARKALPQDLVDEAGETDDDSCDSIDASSNRA